MTAPTEAIVDVRDVFVAFAGPARSVMALRGADLVVAAGERLVVQGPNGSGKSTLLQVITGEQPVVAGTVRVGDTAVHELGAAQRRRWRARNIGFLEQHARRNLLAELNVVDNVALQLRLTGASGRSARRTARRVLGDLGLSELADRRVWQLSGGDAQRVAICAAVAHRPRLVLADEPTAELDGNSARAVYEMLSRIADGGASVILVSHDPQSPQFADRAVRIRDGRVAEQWWFGAPEVEQVPDSRGWIRVPFETMTPLPLHSGLVASSAADGVLLRPGRVGRTTGSDTAPNAGSDGSTPDRSWFDGEPATEGQRSGFPAGAGGTRLAALTAVAAAYPGRPVFEGVDLQIGPGDWVAVTGRSGSGKSTLLSIVAGLLDPSAGTVQVGGTGWAHLDRSGRAALRRSALALAPQRPALVEALTVRENLNLTVSVRGAPVQGAEVARIADRLGLTGLLGQPVDRLSGGERQRVALARCLVSGAPLLVLDEPTSQQDEASADRVIAMLVEETAAGRAVLAASHDPRLNLHAPAAVDLDAAASRHD